MTETGHNNASCLAQLLLPRSDRFGTVDFPLTLSTFALIILRFFAPFDVPSSSFCGGGVGGRDGRGLLAAFVVFDATFSFRVGRLATFAERPMLMSGVESFALPLGDKLDMSM